MGAAEHKREAKFYQEAGDKAFADGDLAKANFCYGRAKYEERMATESGGRKPCDGSLDIGWLHLKPLDESGS